jgi:probable F420-dependent oxidoreductase
MAVSEELGFALPADRRLVLKPGDFHLRYAYHASMCRPDYYLPLAIAAEEAGFDTFTVPDSLCYPEESNSEYPYNGDGDREFLDGVPFLEPFSLIPAMGAVTSKIRFTTSVVKLAVRQPVVVAKSISSIAVLTGDRFGFGVGISPWPEDFAATQIPWEKRGRRMDEMIEIVKGLLSGEYFSYEGEIFQIESMKICPAPAKPIPFLIGGHARPALRRAGRLADGFIHTGGDLEELTRMIADINGYRREFGRDHLPFEFQAMTGEVFKPDGAKRLEDLGVEECIIGFRDVYAKEPDTKSLEEKIGEIRWFADTYIHKA